MADNVALVTLCLDECPQECGSCQGTICRSCAALAAEQRFLVLVADDAEVLTGEIGSHNLGNRRGGWLDHMRTLLQRGTS